MKGERERVSKRGRDKDREVFDFWYFSFNSIIEYSTLVCLWMIDDSWSVWVLFILLSSMKVYVEFQKFKYSGQIDEWVFREIFPGRISSSHYQHQTLRTGKYHQGSLSNLDCSYAEMTRSIFPIFHPWAIHFWISVGPSTIRRVLGEIVSDPCRFASESAVIDLLASTLVFNDFCADFDAELNTLLVLLGREDFDGSTFTSALLLTPLFWLMPLNGEEFWDDSHSSVDKVSAVAAAEENDGDKMLPLLFCWKRKCLHMLLLRLIRRDLLERMLPSQVCVSLVETGFNRTLNLGCKHNPPASFYSLFNKRTEASKLHDERMEIHHLCNSFARLLSCQDNDSHPWVCGRYKTVFSLVLPFDLSLQ